IEAQIAEMEAAGLTGQSGLQRFGESMERTGRIASDVASAMLGQYGPLSGDQKASYALKALGEGAISLDAALQAGREVYASGRDCNDFFQRAIALAGKGQQQDTGSHQTQQFSAALRDLIEQRDLLLDAEDSTNRFGQASQLAQIVADAAGFGGQ